MTTFLFLIRLLFAKLCDDISHDIYHSYDRLLRVCGDTASGLTIYIIGTNFKYIQAHVN